MAILKIRDGDGNVYEILALRGPAGKSAYSYAQDGGYLGSESDFAAMLAHIENNGITVVDGMLNVTYTQEG